ncbi:MAG: Flp pilus assembly complex ATPase component TadA [Lentisphaeria bacterium]|nr:Flp pilus assembly complex ATPase component TadA [Lentisphaeria bacterium]
MQNNEYVLELLIENGLLSNDQLPEGWDLVEKSNGQLGIIDALIQLNYINEEEMIALLAQEYGMELMDLASYQIPQDILGLIPKDIVLQYKVVPVMIHDNILTIAMNDPTDMAKLDSLRFALKRDIDAVIAPTKQIQAVIDKFYSGLDTGIDELIDEIGGEAKDIAVVKEDDPAMMEDEDAPIIRLVTMLIVEAHNLKASDIHLEPTEKQYKIRYRIDGALREMESPPKYLQQNITQRLKIMSKLDITEKRIPQDGRIQLRVVGCEVDLRVSTIPTTHGESIVMRLLEKSAIQLEIPQLGFYADDQAKINKIINMPDGVFLVTGPTGSGKTTSLYAFLNTINTPNRKIITAEDPVEYQLQGINQVQIDNITGLTFANALRAMLRQAPNIIMVGEIRDCETAEIAINAALTGHLVFSTLHTNDAPSAITRLIDMGVKPFLVASAVRAIMAQRLVRRICKNCMEEAEPTPTERRLLGLDDKFMDTAKVMKGKGCSICGGTGYKGRLGIYEIFLVGEEIQHLIFEKCSADVIRDAARKGGMMTLREDGLRKAAAGTTTLSEILAATVSDSQ